MDDSKIAEVLSKLAEKLGCTVEYLWAALLKQAPLYGISQLIYMGLIVCFWAVHIWFVRKLIKRWDMLDDEPQAASDFGLIILGVALIFPTAFQLGQLPLVLSAFFNQEYWALQEVIRLVR